MQDKDKIRGRITCHQVHQTACRSRHTSTRHHTICVPLANSDGCVFVAFASQTTVRCDTTTRGPGSSVAVAVRPRGPRVAIGGRPNVSQVDWYPRLRRWGFACASPCSTPRTCATMRRAIWRPHMPNGRTRVDWCEPNAAPNATMNRQLRIPMRNARRSPDAQRHSAERVLHLTYCGYSSPPSGDSLRHTGFCLHRCELAVCPTPRP